MSDFVPMADELDHQILMHRDAHFGGSFPFMIEYYLKEGKGVLEEVEVDKIEYLQSVEAQLNQNLSELLLTEQEQEEVQAAREKYLALRALYEQEKPLSEIPRLVADLIFSEEEEPEEEIAQLVLRGSKAVMPLISLLSSDDFYNPLSPGYGQAPGLAAICLGRLRDERAIRPLFEALHREGFFLEEELLEALKQIGDKARDALLKSLVREPFTKENELAAIALCRFGSDPHIAKACLTLLQDPRILTRPIFSAHLVLCCEGLLNQQERQTFVRLSENPALSKDLQYEMKSIIRSWK
jgi:HEAT repeat protein